MSVSGATRKASGAQGGGDPDWFERAARIGLIAYGVVHLVIAWMAVLLAFGERSGEASTSGAVDQLAEQPFGQVLVAGVAVGMALLVIWRGAEAFAGHDDEDGATRARKRLASAGKGVIYAAIGFSAARIVLDSGGSNSNSEQQTDTITSRIMDLPAGQVLVGAVGVGIIAFGLAHVVKAWSESYAEHLDGEGRSGTAGSAYLLFGKVGYTAKGVALGVVGGLFVYAALTRDPQRSGGLDQALRRVLEAPAGPVLLVATALGIGCYGLFCLARARHLSDTGSPG
jgi:hypothetical protein